MLPVEVQVVILLFLFALGSAVGSFLNVVIYRLPRGLSVSEPRRSFCPECEHRIRWYDNVPILSFLMLGRRCRDCGAVISWRYPLVEALTGLLFALIYLCQGIQGRAGVGELMIMMMVGCLLIAASAIDLDWFIIPDEISLFGVVGGLLTGLLMPQLHVGAAPYHSFESLTGLWNLDGLLGSAIGALGSGLLVLFVAVVGALVFRREAMGIGDAKLLAMVGAFFGWKVALAAFFVAPFVGLAYGIPLLIFRDEHVMPYGPFLSIGAVVAMLFRAELCSFLEPLEYVVTEMIL